MFVNISYSQQPFNPLTDCLMPDTGTLGSSAAYVGGLLKPHRTDLSGGIPITDSLSKLNILIVFVQFSNESIPSSEWPIDGTPAYMNDLLALNKNSNGNYWDRYNENTQTLSDWYQEVSKGRMHVTGKAYNIFLDHEDTYYRDSGMTVMNNEIYQKLQNLGTINWQDYDLWRKGTDELFYYEPDKTIDMIYKIHRHRGNTGDLFGGSGGYAQLGGSDYYIITGSDTIIINQGYYVNGSGLTIFGTAGGPVGKIFAFNVARHEYGHYLFGNFHTNCGIMGKGDAFLSPWEVIKLGYYTKQVVDYDYNDYSLSDYSARYTSGEILEVPVNGSSEFFLVSNRRKVSNYDIIMLGDSSKGNPFNNTAELGKGLYIYHIADGYVYPYRMDEECADGLWNWTQTGYSAPDWDPTNIWLPVLKHTSVSYNNEVTCVDYCSVKLYDSDDRNVRGLDINNVSAEKWFSKGGNPLLDRIYTNKDSNWTSRSSYGDRYDAWNIGYNQIFSPYSSPNTNSWDNVSTGIFIYYSGLNNSIADLKIYRTNNGGYNLVQILAQTPPSKPMGLSVDYYSETEDIMRPIVTWNHNKEPDMLRDDLKKRYKIWRATASSMASVPADYILLKTIDIDSGTAPVYIDTSIIALGSYFHGTGGQMQYPVRYTVQAIDKYQDSSVRSDFGSAIGLLYCGDACAFGEDNNLQNEQSPKKYSLNQNYPNPFNPLTKIKYDLPNDNFVTIKIYDILGKELLNLVNEFKQAGSYSVTFDATNYPSGVYYYKIKTGSFVQVRKMILIR